MANSKVIFGGEVLIDLTADTVKEDNLLIGNTAHGANGEIVEGACTFDADTSDANITPDVVLDGAEGYAKGIKVIGKMPNNNGTNYNISDLDSHTIDKGYHDGSGVAKISDTEKTKIIPDNIRQGVTILGVSGTMSGTEGANAQSKEVTPSTVEQTVLPDTDQGYNYLAQVTVKAIPYSESANSAGGTTVTIA
jgi:hypothetical protein